MLETLSIMLVDDNEFDLFLQQKFLENKKIAHKIEKYQFANDALKFMESCNTEQMPDLILLDIHMPVTNGFKFLKLFGELPEDKTKNTSIVMVSSSIDAGDIKNASESPSVLKLLNKPLQVDLLISLLREKGVLK